MAAALTPFFSRSSIEPLFQSFSENTVGFAGGVNTLAQEDVIAILLTLGLYACH